jgi:hypothetical protein
MDRVADFISNGFTEFIIQNAQEPHLNGLIVSFALYVQCLVRNGLTVSVIDFIILFLSLTWQIGSSLLRFITSVAIWSFELTMRSLALGEALFLL